MSIPKPVYNPPFNVTRASHSVLTVKDLAVSRNFYVDLIGFIVSDEDKDTIYLRGVAEACHHSLVLKRAKGEPQAERVGMRVFTEEGLIAPDLVIVSHGPQTAIGHEPGYGPIEPGEPVVVDLFPRDAETGCYADITRTFCIG